MAANHAPMAPCLFSEAVVKRLACSVGTSSAATASSVSSHARERPAWLTQPMTAPHNAATTMMPVQDQKWEKTVSGESLPEARCSVVTVIPCQ